MSAVLAMSAVPEQISIEAGPSRRGGVSNTVRFLVSFFIAFLIASADFVDALVWLRLHLPSVVLKFLHLPGYLLCDYVRVTEPLPVDDRAIFEMGQDMYCWFVRFVLDIPYHTLLIFGAWWLVGRLRNRNPTVQNLVHTPESL
jgi:hypothetical protein